MCGRSCCCCLIDVHRIAHERTCSKSFHVRLLCSARIPTTTTTTAAHMLRLMWDTHSARLSTFMSDADGDAPITTADLLLAATARHQSRADSEEGATEDGKTTLQRLLNARRAAVGSVPIC